MTAVYDVTVDLEANLGGPRGDRRWLPIQVRDALDRGEGPVLFGRRTRGVVGVPACPLTANAAWVSAMAGYGFDVLTRKTVRSVAREAHPFPQWLIGAARPGGGDSAGDGGGDVGDVGDVGVTLDPAGAGPASSANSFGVPSPEPRVWQADLESCLEVVGSGQVVIASVMGSPELYAGADLVDDFVRVALLAAAVGVRAVELNLSCPNTLHAQGHGTNDPLCADAAAAAEVVEAVRAELPARVGLVAKLSDLPPDPLADVLARIAPAVDAVAGINAVQRPVVDAAGAPAFGPARARAGVSGAAVREQGLAFVRSVRRHRDALGADFAIFGMGGVLTVDDVTAFLEAGADVVQSATGACLDPGLAERHRAAGHAGAAGGDVVVQTGAARSTGADTPTGADVSTGAGGVR